MSGANRPDPRDAVAVVAIGRNEGERLERCLRAAVRRVARVVYVDSGSTDGSVDAARSLGAEVVELDLSIPFTAARGRNAGWRRVVELQPDLEVVQFLDGDCELVEGWLERGLATLRERPDAAAVSGRRRERDRVATIYNRLIDMEWDTPIGEVRSCHGDVMIRLEAVRQVDGFDPKVIAAEDDEICVRLRQAGWTILRIDADMTRHDAAMTRFGQWWKRAVRGGHGFAQGYAMHGRPPERHFARELRRCVTWGGVLPIIVISLAWPTRGLSAVLLLGYGVSAWRAYRSRRRRGDTPADARLFAAFGVPAKFAEALGALRYAWRRLLKRDPRLIEYK